MRHEEKKTIKKTLSVQCIVQTRLNNPEELDLELFGYWQTEEYIPPPAVNVSTHKGHFVTHLRGSGLT